MTKTDLRGSIAGSRSFWIAVGCIVVAFYFFGLWIPLVGPDEPRYAQVAREMFEKGDWITPTLGGFPWFEKPVLLYWLEMVSYKLLGIGETSSRVGPAIFGLGTVLLMWILGRSVSMSDGTTEKTFPTLGEWAALLAATSIGLMVFSRGASFDVILTFPITGSLVCYFIYDIQKDRGRSSPGMLASVYIFAGLALLAKGLVGVVFPFGIVLVYHSLLRKFPHRSVLLSLVWGTAITVMIAAVWYVPVYERNGWRFVDEFIIQHHFQRFTSNKYFHPQPFYFFFIVLPLMTIPWLPFFATGTWAGFRSILEKPRTDREKLVALSIAWMMVPLIFFSFSGSKLPGYILPALPAAIVLASLRVTGLAQRSITGTRIILGLAGATVVCILALLLFVVPRFADSDSVKRLVSEADALGYGSAEVLSLHTLSHNAEFYAPGRLLRNADGTQKKLYGPTEVKNEIDRRNGEVVLVILPNEYRGQLAGDADLTTTFIADNGELSIAAVSRSHE